MPEIEDNSHTFKWILLIGGTLLFLGFIWLGTQYFDYENQEQPEVKTQPQSTSTKGVSVKDDPVSVDSSELDKIKLDFDKKKSNQESYTTEEQNNSLDSLHDRATTKDNRTKDNSNSKDQQAEELDNLHESYGA